MYGNRYDARSMRQVPATGNRTTNRQPSVMFCTSTRPPCASTRPRTIASPSPPRPLRRRRCAGVRAGSPRNATSKTRGRSASGMPPQASATASQAAVRVPAGGRRGRCRPPGCAGSRCSSRLADHPGQLRLAAASPSASPTRRRPAGSARAAASGAVAGDRVGDDVAERDRGQRQPQRAGVDPGQLEQVVDQPAPSGRSPPGSGGGSRRPSPGRRPRRPPAPRPSPAARPAGCAGRARPRRPARGGPPRSAAPAPVPRPPTSPPRRAGGRSASRRARLTTPAARDGDQHHLQVVLGEEHRLGDADDPGDHGEHGDGEQHADVHDDRPAAQRAQHQPARQQHRRSAPRPARRSEDQRPGHVIEPARSGSRRPRR